MSARVPLAAAAMLVVLTSSSAGRADEASLFAYFDRDHSRRTGCTVANAEGIVPGIDLRLRTRIDLDTLEVISVTTAVCTDPEAQTFGPESPVVGTQTPPWPVVVGEGTSGSTLIETALPLGAVPLAPVLDVAFWLATPAGGDALRVESPFPVPLTTTWGALALALLLAAAAIAAGGRRHPRALVGLALVASLASPALVRAALGDGSLRAWSAGDSIGTDALGDAPVGADLLAAFAAVDTEKNTLFLRLDALLGPAVCLPWPTVDPGSGYSCNQEPPPDAGPFANRVALTFDDGPNPATTPAILATLRAENVPATFFMVGWRLESPEGQALAREIHEDPLFRVANHSYTHPFFTGLTPEQARDEIVATTEAIRFALDDPCYFPRFFRFPFSASSCATVEIVREQGLSMVGFHVDSLDWCYALGNGYCSPAYVGGMPDALRSDMLGWILYMMQQRQGGVVLMHDIHPNTVQQLPTVIAGLRSAGFEFVRLDDASVFPLIDAAVNPPEPPACCDGAIH